MKQLSIIRPTLEGYNPKGDKNNCTVVTLAAVTGIPYPEAYEICKKAGRKDGKGMYSHELIAYFNRNHSDKGKFKEIDLNGRSRMSLNKFLYNYPRGHFYVRKRSHVFTVSNGVVLDMICDVGKKTQVTKAWLYESNERINRLKKIVKELEVPANS
jgi:hypothetical protein